MNGRQRTQAALDGRPVDRPPVMLHNFMHAAKEAGYTMAAYRRDPRKIAESFVRSVETYGYDGIVVDIDTATLAGACGVPIDFPENEPARTAGACLVSLDAVQDLDPPDVAAYGQVQVWLEAVSLLVDQCGDEVFVRGNCDQAPFSLASMMRGTSAWMLDLVTDPTSVHGLLEYCTEATSQFLRLMAQTGAHMVSNGDSPAGPAMISPAMYEEFALPYERRVARAAGDLPYGLHICGNTDVILHLLIQSGASAVELDYKTNAQKAHDLLAGRMTFIGNIDPTGVLTMGTPNDVTRAVAELMRIFSDTPRFILNAGCAIPDSAPAENIRALVAAVI